MLTAMLKTTEGCLFVSLVMDGGMKRRLGQDISRNICGSVTSGYGMGEQSPWVLSLLLLLKTLFLLGMACEVCLLTRSKQAGLGKVYIMIEGSSAHNRSVYPRKRGIY